MNPVSVQPVLYREHDILVVGEDGAENITRFTECRARALAALEPDQQNRWLDLVGRLIAE